MTGESAQALLISRGATSVGQASDLNPNASARHANTLAFTAPRGGIEAVVAAYAITRVLPIMYNFGLSTPEAIV
ncbi:hypothetical protein ADILRU_2346 [Leifsonia rubra CMS 76R]|nr:hypothetical protein ADILRU_2346 [Leifsonia rubra CMS 76R]